jgi:hypothetical protein
MNQHRVLLSGLTRPRVFKEKNQDHDQMILKLFSLIYETKINCFRLKLNGQIHKQDVNNYYLQNALLYFGIK